MLRREKDRLEKDVFALEKKLNTDKRQLASIIKRMEGLQKEVHKEDTIKTYRNVPTKPLKTLEISY